MRSPFRRLATYVMWGQLFLVAQVAHASADSTDVNRSLDARLLIAVYDVEDPVFSTVMYAADALAYPVFYGAVPISWGASLLSGDQDDLQRAYQLTLSFVTAYATSTLLKEITRRPRPDLPGVEERVRSRRQQGFEDAHFVFSMPSGHATLAFAIAASLSFSYPHWYVAIPAATWASATAVSRVWRGRHYPTDVLVGVLLGTGIAATVSLAGDTITPAFLRPEQSGSGVPLTIVLRL